jgi:hypothetical protein
MLAPSIFFFDVLCVARCRKAAASQAAAVGRVPAALANVTAVAAAAPGFPAQVMRQSVPLQLSFPQSFALFLRKLSFDQPLNGRDPSSISTPVKAGQRIGGAVEQLFCIGVVRILD